MIPENPGASRRIPGNPRGSWGVLEDPRESRRSQIVLGNRRGSQKSVEHPGASPGIPEDPRESRSVLEDPKSSRGILERSRRSQSITVEPRKSWRIPEDPRDLESDGALGSGGTEIQGSPDPGISQKKKGAQKSTGS